MSATTAGPRVETPLERFVAEFAASRVALAGFVVFAMIVLLALLAPWIAPQDPYDLAQLDIMDGRLEPGSVGAGGVTHWLGTDDQGRDMLSGILYGLRISLMVGAGSALIARTKPRSQITAPPCRARAAPAYNPDPLRDRRLASGRSHPRAE